MTMSAVDFLDQWFETDVLKATMSASGIIGTFLGVRSPGTAYVLLHHYMGEIDGAFRSWGFARGGTGAISNAIAAAAREAGVEIRTEAPVARISVRRTAQATGVVLAERRRVRGRPRAVERRSAPDVPEVPRREGAAGRTSSTEVRRYKFRGSSGKVNLALDALPDFTCLPGAGAASARRHLDLPERRLHGARLRPGEVRRVLAAAVHRHGHPDAHRSVGRAARQAHPVVLRAIRALQAGVAAPGTNSARRSATPSSTRSPSTRRIIRDIILHRQVLTPLDLEREFGLTEGNIFQGELTLEQLFFARPVPGWAQYKTPIRESVDVRIGDASRRRHHGRAGAELRRCGSLDEQTRGSPRSRHRDDVRRMHDVIVIGGGHNGLDRRGLSRESGPEDARPRTHAIAWAAARRTGDLAPGFRCPTLAHAAAIDPAIVRGLGLERQGLRIIRPEAHVCAPTADGRALVLWADARRAIDEVRAFSTADADHYPRFLASFAAIARVLRRVCEMTPPALDDPKAADLIELLKTGRAFRALGKADAYRLLRWMPMAVADFAGEWFESEPLRATVAAGGIAGSFLGPWSAGSAAILLLLGAGEGHPVATGWFTAGGPGALADALAAAARSRPAPRSAPAPTSRGSTSQTRPRPASHSPAASRFPPGPSSLSADPKRTLLGLVDPIHLAPDFIRHVQNIRAHGTLAKVNYAVSGLPDFTGLSARDANQQATALSGRVRLAADIDAIERAFDAAKYGGFSEEPWIELAIPSIADPSLAPAGQHVVSAYVQYAPHRLRGDRGWDALRESLGDAATRTIGRYAPGFESSVIAARRDHAAGSRAHVRPDRRPHLSRRARARSVLHGAPAARMGALRDTGSPPVSLQRRHPPRHRPERALRSTRRPRDPTRPETPVIW